jgi:dihydrodipicolinate synthase/N-acetylneuraminate lyase
MPEPTLTLRDANLIAAEAICTAKTVRAVYAGGGKPNTRERIERAAKVLNLPQPPTRPRDPAQRAQSNEPA